MLDISRSERFLILTFLIFGVLFAGLSHYKKIGPHPEIRIIDIDETYTLIDINTADAIQLERLPGIGPVLATDIIAYREGTGGFRSLEEIKNVKGIGDRKFEKIKDLISIGE